MLKIVLAVVVLAIAAVLVVAAFKPDTFKVQRRAVIKAPPEKIYPLLSDFQRWGAWSPWEKKDPVWDMQGPVPYVGKIMHVFINMDRMVGADFEAGLANLKTLAEK